MPRRRQFDVFLSHSHEDAHVVEGLALRLEDEANLSVWLDKWVLVPGEKWQQAVARALTDARSCGVCIGAQTPTGWFREEIERAINFQVSNPKFRVIPILLPDAQEPSVDDFLELRTWVDLRLGFDGGDAFHTLVCGIQGRPRGRGPIAMGSVDAKHAQVRRRLTQLRGLRDERLVDDSVVVEFQRRLLEELIEG